MADHQSVLRTYLGDGAYADFNGYDVVVWCDRNGLRHHVHLEPDMVQKLVGFLREAGWRIE